MRLIVLLWLLSNLAGCALFGPPSINYSRTDIEQRAFIDRKSGEFGKLFAGLEPLGLSGPEVGFMTASQRIELAWTAKLPDAPLGLPLSFRVAISGKPKLNAEKLGIDLADVRLEEFRMPAIPFLNLAGNNTREGTVMGSIPLLHFYPEELRRNGLVYQPDQLSLGLFGLRVNLMPK